jgi:hypothetical protein
VAVGVAVGVGVGDAVWTGVAEGTGVGVGAPRIGATAVPEFPEQPATAIPATAESKKRRDA